MTEQEQTYLEMMIGCYITGKMHQNYIQSVIKTRKEVGKDEKYLHNKLDQSFKAVAKLLKPLDKFLLDTGGFEDVDNSIMLYHEVVDEVFGLDEAGLKRVGNLIKKINKGK